MTNKQKAALALVGAAVLTLVGCTLTKQWFNTNFGVTEFNVGLLSMEGCWMESCERTPLSEAFEDSDSGLYVTASKATFGFGLASAGLLAVLAVFGYKRHDKVGVLGKVTLLVLIVTVIASIVVVAKKPPVANASLGVFLFMVGGMAGSIGAHMLSEPSTYEEVERDPSIPRL